MKQILIVRFSKVGSLPLLGYIFYGLQLLLLKTNLSHVLYLSGKDKRYIATIVSLAERSVDEVVCETLLVGHPLVFFTRPITLKLERQALGLIEHYSETMYNRVVWTLACIKNVDQKTRKTMVQSWGVDILPLIKRSY
jgi:hypothetical protein